MRLSLFRRHAPAAADPLLLSPDLPIAGLRERFGLQKRVEIPGLLSAASANAIAHAVAKRRFECRAPLPADLARGTPSYMYYEDSVRPHRACRRACAPICAMTRSLSDGALLALVRDVTADATLKPTTISLRAYVKGSHVDSSAAAERGVDVALCLTPGWEAAFGGHLSFGDEPPAAPHFGSLYIVERRAGDASTLSLVNQHGPLVMLGAWLH